MEQSDFVKEIQSCRRRLNLAGLLKYLVSALGIGAVVGIGFQAASFVIPVYYAGMYAVLALVLALLTALTVAYVKRTNMEQTALVMDSFGFDERIVTAYENLEKGGPLVGLQRTDAIQQLREHRDRIRIALLPPWKKIGSLMGLLVVLLVLALVPSKMKDQAKEMHSVKEEAKEKTDEIEELVEALEQLEQEEELTPEQQAVLQEMIESLQASQSEYQQASSNEMMQAATEKLNYRYENMGSQLASLAQSLQNGATVSSVTAESMQALSNKMQEMSGTQLANANGNTRQSDMGSGDGQGSQNGQSGNNGQNDNNGSNGGSGQNGSGGQSGDNGNGGNGGSDGSGNGRGTGTSDTPHDYVSIPNDIADNGNLTGNAVDHEASEYFHAQNGLSWEGTHMSYEAVIGSYEQNAYEGIAAGKYPSGMEEIIKEYFSNFN